MVREIELEPSERGGGKGPDVSDDLSQMQYAEKFVSDVETLTSLSKRDVMNGQDKYRYTVTDMTELKERYNLKADTASMSSVLRQVNAVFVAWEIPFLASIKSGGKAGKSAEILKIYKYADEFDPTRYACLEGKRESTKYPGTVLRHEEPTEGNRRRTIRWIKEVGAKDCPDILEKLNIGEDHLLAIEKKLEWVIAEKDRIKKEEVAKEEEEVEKDLATESEA